MINEYFQRTSLLAGKQGMEKLNESSVLVTGLGGVGSFAAEALARCGIGKMTLVDFDRVEASNINRQLPALSSTLGRFKTDLMAERLLDINPSLILDVHTQPYTAETSQLIGKQWDYDYIIDAIDSLPDKVHLIISSLQNQVPIISCMGTANRVYSSMLQIADIEATTTCPLARRLRKELRKSGINRGVEVLYSRETPMRMESPPGALGSMVYVTAVAGLLMAGHAVNRMLGLLET